MIPMVYYSGPTPPTASNVPGIPGDQPRRSDGMIVGSLLSYGLCFLLALLTH